jgi:ankyrin repeat protein
METLILIVLVVLFLYILIREQFTVTVSVPETENKPIITTEPSGTTSVASSPAPVAVNELDNRGHTPLMNAIVYNDANKVKQLIAEGADINKKNTDGFPPLVIATYMKDMNIMKSLLTAGANLNITDPKGNTPLLVAVALNNLELTKLLVESGANINPPKNDLGSTPLRLASGFIDENGNSYSQRNPEIEAYLISKGATA